MVQRSSVPPDSLNAADRFVVFHTRLGWMALAGRDQAVKRLWFGYPSRRALLEVCRHELGGHVPLAGWYPELVERLRSYAAGEPEDFADVQVDLRPLPAFHARVVSLCRTIPRGTTLSYSQLATLAGSPSGARAVGNCMARNPIPLIIPCHRVVAAGGSLGGYSAPGGLAMKRRLLELEQRR